MMIFFKSGRVLKNMFFVNSRTHKQQKYYLLNYKDRSEEKGVKK